MAQSPDREEGSPMSDEDSSIPLAIPLRRGLEDAGLGTLGVIPASDRPPGVTRVIYPETYKSHGNPQKTKIFKVGEIWTDTEVNVGVFNSPCGPTDSWYVFERETTDYNTDPYLDQLHFGGRTLKDGARVKVVGKTECSEDPNWKIYDLRVMETISRKT